MQILVGGSLQLFYLLGYEVINGKYPIAFSPAGLV